MRLAVLPIAVALAHGVLMPAVAQSRPGIAGSYLAARQAVIDGNHREAAFYLEQALITDPNDAELIGRAILAHAALGQWEHALNNAARLPDNAPRRELANLVELVELARQGEFAAAKGMIEAGRGVGHLADGLVLAWLHLGEGDKSAAVDGFTGLAKGEGGSLAEIARYHLALARAVTGDFEGADVILSGEAYGPLEATTRGIQTHAQVLVQLGQQDAALELLDNTISLTADPVLLELRELIVAYPARPYDFLIDAKAGVAEVFFSLAQGMGGDNGAALPLLYTRAAHRIDNEHSDALILAGDLLRQDGLPHLAADAYAEVRSEGPKGIAARLGQAEAMFDMGQGAAAAALLQDLAGMHPDLATVHGALGDVLRRQERFADAAAAYSDALVLMDPDQPRAWFLYYVRGISLERDNRWDEAERDFRRALALNPDQPQVLNYLGYSLVEQHRNLDEALDMIERAVAAEPQSGYIVDSLGWVLYRLGRFEDAVDPMERAVRLRPNDPIINDHLGDVYYRVGRRREAEFQWHRALSFDPTREEAARIRLKLELGLTRVLELESIADRTQ
ncbi:MAG: tetratricopeptide repeat protein [Rhodobacteraceae bacterium]|nr:tetratricopeptide repeat protein [Paracoccaceae bacterium]